MKILQIIKDFEEIEKATKIALDIIYKDKKNDKFGDALEMRNSNQILKLKLQEITQKLKEIDKNLPPRFLAGMPGAP
jgi:hypothetical protein